MAKISTKDEIQISAHHNLGKSKGVHYLDTLEITSDFFRSKSHERLYSTAIQKGKVLNNIYKLIDVSSNERKRQYWKSFHCSNVYIQDGQRLSSSLCRKRWCTICSRKKTNELIKAYAQPLTQLIDSNNNLYHVVLTAPTVNAKHLKHEIRSRIKAFQKIKDNMRKNYGLKLNGFRKIECTHNKQSNKFHPHFHVICQGLNESQMLLNLWLKQYPNARLISQSIGLITHNEQKPFVEMFKYATKQSVKDETEAAAEDIIYQSLEGIRIYQPFGVIKKVKHPTEANEDILKADFIETKQEIYVYCKDEKDYISADNTRLIGTNDITDRIIAQSALKVLKMDKNSITTAHT